MIQKDKRKVPSMGTVILLSALLLCRYGRKTNTSADLSGHSLPICPRDVFRVTDRSAFRLDGRNKLLPSYGNGCCRGFPPRFPDPRSRQRRNRQCTLAVYAMICVYSFVGIIIPRCFAFCKRIEVFYDKNSAAYGFPYTAAVIHLWKEGVFNQTQP